MAVPVEQAMALWVHVGVAADVDRDPLDADGVEVCG